MSLTKCPDCGKQVSTLAHSCPHCGLSGEHIYGGGGGGGVLEGIWAFFSRAILFFGAIILVIGAIVCLFMGKIFISLAMVAAAYGMWRLLSYINRD